MRWDQGRRQVKKCGVDTRGERTKHEPITGSGCGAPSGVQGQWVTGQSPWSWKPFSIWCPNHDRLPTPLLPSKNTGFASVSGTTSGKSGVDMSTPVHPVATPLDEMRWDEMRRVMWTVIYLVHRVCLGTNEPRPPCSQLHTHRRPRPILVLSWSAKTLKQ